MKIVCDACSAKYQIADEKVAGKVFKIRCKRCENIIVVRGDSAGAGAGEGEPQFEQKETRVFDYSGYESPSDAAKAAEDDAAEGVWHLVIDQEQVGPLTIDEVGARLSAGEVDGDSYVWREGFSGWERLADVDELATVLAGDAPTVAGGEAASGEDSGLFGGFAGGNTEQTDPAEVFAATNQPAADPGSDLFGGGATAVDPSGGLFGLSDAEEPESPEKSGQQLRGERNENSVLFSLSNLATLAGDSSSSPAASGASPAAPTAGVSAPSKTSTTEGSGLIDIRSMAQVYLGADKGASGAAGAPKAGVGSADDLPSFSPSAFGANPAMLLPSSPVADDNKKLIYALVGASSLLAIVAIVLVVLVLKGKDTPTTASTTGDSVENPDGTGAGDGTEGEDDGDKDPDDKDGEDEAKGTTGDTDKTAALEDKKTEEPAKDKKAADTDKSAAKAKTSTASRKAESSTKSTRKSTTTKSSKPREPKESPPPTKSTSGKCDEITCLVEPNKACCKKYPGKTRETKTNSNLPEKLSKSDVRSGMSKIGGKVRSCGAKHSASGVVRVKVKVSGSGRVSSATPSKGDAVGRCVASAVKRARFKKTQKGASFTYPFRL